MSWINQTNQIKWDETCRCECKLNSIVCNNKQKWNKDKCKCECKELVDKQERNKGFIWNPSNCNCECDKSSNISEYLDCKNCNCRKKATYSLVEECDKNTDKNELIRNETLSIKNYNRSTNKDLKTSSSSNSSKPYVALSILFLIISVTISSAFVYFHFNSHPKKYKVIILIKKIKGGSDHQISKIYFNPLHFFHLNSHSKNYKLIITNINENHNTSKYKKPSELFF